MAKVANINVQVKMCVDEDTAKACLKIAEMLVNQTGRDILVHKKKNGEVEFSYEPAG